MKFLRYTLILALVASALPYAADARSHKNRGATVTNDVVYDNRGGNVYDNRGGCVRTKWLNDTGTAGCGAARTAVTVYFDFNKSTLTKQAKRDLAAFVREAKADGKPINTIIVGYADRIGGDSYNIRLSQKRAQAVRAYLASRGWKSKLGEIKGLGETNSKTACANVSKPELIKCLARDRRVEVQVELVGK